MKPLVLVFVSDLFFSMRIESAIEGLGYGVEIIEKEEDLPRLGGRDATDDNPAEALRGRQGALLQKVTTRRPGLIIFDLNNHAVPWQAWISRLKSAPATRRIPVLTFGSHMDVETMTLAKDCGADAVLARSKFTSELPQLVQKYIQVPDTEAVQEACQGPLSDLGRQGLDLFNRGEYFESHERLEDAWNEDDGPAKEFYRAVLQVAVAYLQIERRNYRGAVKMFLRMRQWLDPLPAVCRGVDVEQLRQDARAVEDRLVEAGPEGFEELEWGAFEPVRFVK